MVLEFQVDTISFRLKEAKVVAQGVEERVKPVKAKTQAIEVEVTLTSTRAVEEYKKSKDFRDEVSKATYVLSSKGSLSARKRLQRPSQILT